MDQAVSQAHVQAFFGAATQVASVLTQDAASVEALLGSCARDGSNANACVDGFIQRFGRRALRRPLHADELAFYREVYAAEGRIDARALSDVVSVMLNAPQFIYHVEDRGTDGDAPGVVALDGYAVASRLAYQFWQTLPDEALLAAAENGSLSTEDGYREAVDRVLDDPRTSRTIASFAREWLHLDALRPLDTASGDPVFDAFVGDDVPSPDLRDDMITEVAESLAYHTLEAQDGILGWLGSQHSFARSEELASLYGVPAWDGRGEPPTFPAGERAGLLTRAALLATGSANTRPIMKGVVIRKHILCDNIATPPANVAGAPPELSSELTTREVVEQLTEREGTSCAGCHRIQINGLGFPTESYDALGRVREMQPLFDESGQMMAERPIDTEGVPRVWSTDDRPVADVFELTERIAESGKVEACFARQYFRFTYGREEELDVDGCALEEVRNALTTGGSLRDAFARIALRPEFRQRYVPENG
jgi:hypothetical protein